MNDLFLNRHAIQLYQCNLILFLFRLFVIEGYGHRNARDKCYNLKQFACMVFRVVRPGGFPACIPAQEKHGRSCCNNMMNAHERIIFGVNSIGEFYQCCFSKTIAAYSRKSDASVCADPGMKLTGTAGMIRRQAVLFFGATWLHIGTPQYPGTRRIIMPVLPKNEKIFLKPMPMKSIVFMTAKNYFFAIIFFARQ